MRNSQSGILTTIIYLLLPLLLLLSSCSKDEGEPKKPEYYKIIISDITNLKETVSFDRIRVEISGDEWQIIEVVEAPYKEGKAVLALPKSLPLNKLQRVADSSSARDGFWTAQTDNDNARVAGLGDIFVYNGDKRVGRLYQTTWIGESFTSRNSYLYYHYADQPFTLSGNHKGYTYNASFVEGWNIYVNKHLGEDGDSGALCTTENIDLASFVWRFE